MALLSMIIPNSGSVAAIMDDEPVWCLLSEKFKTPIEGTP